MTCLKIKILKFYPNNCQNPRQVTPLIPFFYLGDGFSYSDILQYGFVELIDNAKCDYLYRSHFNDEKNHVTSNMVCAGNLEVGGVGPCQGDAGGPLVVPDGSSEDSPVLYGLSSWGDSKCAQAKTPEVFTRIMPFVGWIRGYMKGMTI